MLAVLRGGTGNVIRHINKVTRMGDKLLGV